MKLSKALITTAATAMAIVGAGAGVAQAANDGDTLSESCKVTEVIDIPILSSANNNIDCSKSVEEETSLHVEDEDSAQSAVLLPLYEDDKGKKH
ncbi:hypothetical protein ACH5AO_04325 [Streptomyces sp. NPDC018964]|uniref:hypothetical protein n=1 Tax=Streptomyces sp. NPDC018964 TaxID=3365058 RepID=UPI0037B0D9D1